MIALLSCIQQGRAAIMDRTYVRSIERGWRMSSLMFEQPSLLRDSSVMDGGASEDQVGRLRLAIMATRPGSGGPRHIASRLRSYGSAVLAERFASLGAADAEAIDQDARRLAEGGIRAALLTDRDYPVLLSASSAAPPALFYKGRIDLLSAPGVGMCGSRLASADGLRAARECSAAVVATGHTVVSGYARGVDAESHLGALESGGRTLVVLAEGITQFRVKRGDLARCWDGDRVTVISQFSPSQPWHAGTAMARNEVIVRLSRALVVIEAGDKGGTLNAGMRALDIGRPVFALEFHKGAQAGYQALLQRGAVTIRDDQDLLAALAALSGQAAPNLQLPLTYDS
jgi:DNA processing protein